MDTRELLTVASEEGIDPDMAVAMAERLEQTNVWLNSGTNTVGGRYIFNHRSMA